MLFHYEENNCFDIADTNGFSRGVSFYAKLSEYPAIYEAKSVTQGGTLITDKKQLFSLTQDPYFLLKN